MKITLVACGSRGDHQPFLPLAGGLVRNGHEVRVACDEVYADMFAGRGLSVDPYRMGADWIQDLDRWVEPDTALEALRDMTRRTAGNAVPALLRAYQGSDAVISGGMLVAAAVMVGRRYPRPTVLAQWSPIALFRGDSSLASVDSTRSLRNAVAAARYLVAMNGPLMAPARAAAEATGQRWRGPVTLADLAGRSLALPQFFAVSPLVAPGYASSRRTPATGFLRDTETGSLARPLEAFLDAGPAPVFLGLGSATHPGVRDRFGALVGVALAEGQRVITMRASGLGEGDYPADRVCLIDEAPFGAVFPRCSLIVHHGGSGTTAAALAAGTPQFVTPFTTDQPYFGRRVHELGVAVPPVPFPEVRPDHLRAALSAAPALAERAAAVGRAERATHGVRNAVAFVERVLPSGVQRRSGPGVHP